MKIFAVCVGIGFGIFAIVVYAYGLKQRIKELKRKPGKNNLPDIEVLDDPSQPHCRE